jgi:hypothetical protein
MDEYWATRTGRWRRAMRGQTGPSLAERLYQVIRQDVEGGPGSDSKSPCYSKQGGRRIFLRKPAPHSSSI